MVRLPSLGWEQSTMTTINVENSPTLRPKIKQDQYVILALAGVAIVILVASFAFAPPQKDDAVTDEGAWLIGP
jgi:hypothetical protein